MREIGFQSLVVKGLERLSVVEVLAHWIGFLVVLMKMFRLRVFGRNLGSSACRKWMKSFHRRA